MSELADNVGYFVIWLVLPAASLVALGLSIPAARGKLDRHGWPFVLFAVLVAAGLVWLAFYWAGDDSYYAPDHVSRWEHASAPTANIAAAVVFSLASAFALAVAGLSHRYALLRRLTMPAAALSTFAIAATALVTSLH